MTANKSVHDTFFLPNLTPDVGQQENNPINMVQHSNTLSIKYMVRANKTRKHTMV